MIAVSNSEMAMWLRCRRKWFVTYYLGYHPDTEEITGNRILGIRVHTAMQGMYGYGLDPLAVLGVLYSIELERSPEYETELLSERDLASAMVEGYIEWVASSGEDASLSVVATEAEVVVPIPRVEGVSLKARLDQVVLNEVTGLLSFLDFKTAGTFEKHEVLALDPQFKVYSLVQLLASQPVDAYGNTYPDAAGAPRVDGGIIRTMRRVRRTERAKPPFYATDEFRYDPETIESTLKKVQRVAHEIKGARRVLDWAYTEGGGTIDVINEVQRSLFPPNEIPHDCKWSCPLVQLCPMMSDSSDWAGVLMRGGQYEQGDPYAYYSEDPLRRVREELAG
jgi:PD-(D/E)XK nuclease superfamily